MIIGWTVPEIWCMANVIFIFHFWLFFALLPAWQLKNWKFQKNEKSTTGRYHHFTEVYWKLWLYACCTAFEIRRVTDAFVVFILGIFWHFCSHNSPKNESFKKMKKKKKIPGDIMVLQNSTEKYDYRLYCSWDIARDICTCYFSSCALFSAFTPLTAGKMKISEKWKQHLEISSFCSSVPKIMIMCYTVPEIWHITHVIVIFHFGPFFVLLSP